MAKLLEHIAKQTRRWAEKNSHNFSNDLCGMCAIASAELFVRLERRGFKPELIINKDSEHCFVKCDNLYIDITATQFRREPVLISNRLYGSPWITGKKYKKLEDFNNEIKNWPIDQQYIHFPKTSIRKQKKK